MSFGVVTQMAPHVTRPRVTPPLTTSLPRFIMCSTKTSHTSAGGSEGHTLAGNGLSEVVSTSLHFSEELGAPAPEVDFRRGWFLLRSALRIAAVSWI